MNDKQHYLYEVLDICVDECKMDVDGERIVTKELVLGKCKNENVIMTRAIYVSMLLFLGYSKTTIAAVLHRSEQAVRDILNVAHGYRTTSWAYRVAEAKCTLRIEPIKAKY